MTHSQKAVTAALALIVIAVFCGMIYLVGQDISAGQLGPFVSNAQVAGMTPVPPTVIMIWPTETPTPDLRSSSTVEQAVAFVHNFKYDANQQSTVGEIIAAIQSASAKLGNQVTPEGWWAEDQQQDHWIVSYTYRENSTVKTYRFSVDLRRGNVRGYNESGDTILSYLKQEAYAVHVEPTATTVALSLGWAARDYYTNWEYSVPASPRIVKTLAGGGKSIGSQTGFLVIPVMLRNLDPAPQQVGLSFYNRFGLRDSAGKRAGVGSEDSLLNPTAIFCRGQNLAEFTKGAAQVLPEEVIQTALAFRLLPDVRPPFTLEITVYHHNVPHRYDIRLSAE